MNDSSGLIFDSESDISLKKKIEILFEDREDSEKIPIYNVVLLDDNDHTYEYVIEMLMQITGISKIAAFEIACKVDFRGRVIVYTGPKDEAERKRDEIVNYGADWRLARSVGSMSALIETVEKD